MAGLVKLFIFSFIVAAVTSLPTRDVEKRGASGRFKHVKTEVDAFPNKCANKNFGMQNIDQCKKNVCSHGYKAFAFIPWGHFFGNGYCFAYKQLDTCVLTHFDGIVTDIFVKDESQDLEINTEGQCGVPAITPDLGGRIVGGKEAIPHSWPWQVLFEAEYVSEFGKGTSLCAGSVIDKNWVITAAHCDHAGMTNIRVTAGVHNRRIKSSSWQVRSVALDQMFPHEKWGHVSHEFEHDIMLVKLDEPLTLGDEISPVCLPPQGRQLEEDTNTYATGWGVTENHYTSDTLMQVRLPIIGQETCGQPGWNEGITENMICAGYQAGGRDSCQGDSGGPLVSKSGDSFILEGITSHGYGCARENKPGVYTNVANYVNWIKKTIENNS